MSETTEKNATSNLLVICERLDNLKEANAEEHARILEQTTRTNGKVADINKWMWICIGAISILSTFVVPVAIAITIQFISKSFFSTF